MADFAARVAARFTRCFVCLPPADSCPVVFFCSQEARADARASLTAAAATATSSSAWAKSFTKAFPDELADCDGPSTDLFWFLWRVRARRAERRAASAARSRSNRRQKRPGSGLPFSIPDTVVYKHRLPAFWFFTSVQTGEARGEATLHRAPRLTPPRAADTAQEAEPLGEQHHHLRVRAQSGAALVGYRVRTFFLQR